MGVYSNNRMLFSEGYAGNVEAPEPDMSYFGADGANRILAEAAANDLAMFTAVISNDIDQAYVTNAIKEGAALDDQLQSLEEAAAGGIFSKLGEFLKKIWKKITGLIMSFITKIRGSVTSDNKKLVDKFKKKIMANSSIYKDMKYKWSEPRQQDFGYKKPLSKEAVSGECLKRKNIILGDGADLSWSKDNTNGALSNSAINVYDTTVELNEELDKDDFEDKQLGNFIDTTTTSSDFAKDAHEFFFDDENEEDGTFGSKSTDIMSVLTGAKDKIKNLEKTKDDIDKFFKDDLRVIEKWTNTALKYAGTNDKDYTYTDRGISSAVVRKELGDTPTKYGKENLTTAAIHSRAGSALQRFYSAYQQIVTKLLSAQMAALTFHIKQCRRVWIQAASYADRHGTRNVKEDAMLFDAIGEAADFDTDQLFLCHE